jgi:hypothetical protein
MKAIVNIAFRTVELQYSIKPKDMVRFTHAEINKHFKGWETFQKDKNSKILCKHTLCFKDTDEWQSTILFDGRTIDFHYDYEQRKQFECKKDWGNYVFQGYVYVEGEPQLYDENVVKVVVIEF